MTVWRDKVMGWPWLRILTFAGAALASIWLAWFFFFAPSPPKLPKEYALAQPAHGVENVATVPVDVAAPIQVIPKPVASKKLKLPAQIVDDDAKLVTAAVDIPASKSGATVVTVLDSRTGITETLVKEKPRSLISFERGTEVGLRYGIATVGGQTATIYGRQDVLRIGNAFLAGYAEANMDSTGEAEAKVMLDVSMRW